MDFAGGNVMDIQLVSKAHILTAQARPFLTTFTRQMNTARALYGKQIVIPKFSKPEIMEYLVPILEYYPERDRSIISDRVCYSIISRQKYI